MAPPQMALQLVEGGRIAAVFPAHNGQWNRVWRISARSGARYVVKLFRTRWAQGNERAALALAGAQGIPVPAIHAVGGRSIVYEDPGGRVRGTVDEALARSCGYWLSRVHEIDALPDTLRHKPRMTIVGQTMLRARHAGIDLDATGLVHGDPTPENALSDAAGRFLHLIDWEESGLGNPLIDLMLAEIEFCCQDPARAASLAGWLATGYFANPTRGGLRTAWEDADLRAGLFEAGFASLRGWAKDNAKPDLLRRYDDGHAAARTAIVGE